MYRNTHQASFAAASSGDSIELCFEQRTFAVRALTPTVFTSPRHHGKPRMAKPLGKSAFVSRCSPLIWSEHSDKDFAQHCRAMACIVLDGPHYGLALPSATSCLVCGNGSIKNRPCNPATLLRP